MSDIQDIINIVEMQKLYMGLSSKEAQRSARVILTALFRLADQNDWKLETPAPDTLGVTPHVTQGGRVEDIFGDLGTPERPTPKDIIDKTDTKKDDGI